MTAAHNASNEITLSRIYDAPVKMVWEAWTDPAQAAQWWGPRGFTLTTHQKDLRVGGHWHYTMRGPDGVDYVNSTYYLEVVEYSRLVYDHGAQAGNPPLFRVTACFTDLNGKTRLDMTMTLPTPEAAEQTRKFVKKAGGDATWDRLGEYLTKKTSSKEVFLINRAFEAPIDLVYEAWTNPAHLAKWVPPVGFTMEYVKAEIRTGGAAFYSMSGPNGMKMYGKASYIEMTRPSRIVYSQQFCDETGKVARHPMSPTWPETMLTTVLFTAETPSRTRVTVTWEPDGGATPVEIDTFVKGRTGMTGGWTGSFDKLDSFFARP